MLAYWEGRVCVCVHMLGVRCVRVCLGEGLCLCVELEIACVFVCVLCVRVCLFVCLPLGLI